MSSEYDGRIEDKERKVEVASAIDSEEQGFSASIKALIRTGL